MLAARFKKLHQFNPIVRRVALTIIAIAAVPAAFIPALASPNTWSYINSSKVQKSLQESKEKEAKMAQEKQEKENAQKVEQEKRKAQIEAEKAAKVKQEEEKRAILEKEKIENEKKIQEQARIEEDKRRNEEIQKQQQANEQTAAKINNDITFDSEVAAQDVNQAVAANKTIAELQTSTKDKKTFQVISIADGDTIKLADIGTVRLIGIDTPETKDPRKPVQCFGQEASNKIGELLNNNSVYLEFDPAQRIDKYGRTLAYVFRADGLDVNLEMVKQGYAFAYTKYPNPRSSDFINAQNEARTKQAGLWSPSTCNGEQKEVKKETPVIVSVPAPKTQVQAPSAATAPNPAPVTTTQPVPSQNTNNAEVYYPGTCAELTAKGIGNFPKGSINYSAQRDRDKDGIACDL